MNDLRALQMSFLAQIVSADEQDFEQVGMQVYRDAYLLRIDEALRSDFEAVHQILGDDDMLALTADYLETHPSRQPSIRWVGRSLAGFIAASKRWSRVPLLADMARFEWSKSQLFDGLDAEAITLEALQRIAPERWAELQLRLIPALHIEPYPANVPVIWQQLRDRRAVPSPSTETSQAWLLWRKEQVVHWRSLDACEHAALQAVAAGASFAELCQGLLAFADEAQVPGVAMQLVLQWCNDQVICAHDP